MAGFASYDSIINALTVLGTGQDIFFSKTAPAAQVSGAFHTSWAYTGIPAAGSWLGAGGAASATFVSGDNTTTGAVNLVSPSTASATNPYVTTLGAMPTTNVLGTLMLVDRLADTGTLSTVSGGTCTLTMPSGSAWARNADGVGVMAFIESLAGVPTAGGIMTLSYTNTDAVAGRVSSSATTVAGAHRVVGSTGPFIALQGADKGIKSIESFTITTQAALNIALVVCRPIVSIPCVSAMYLTERDLVIQTPKLPKLPVTSDKTACLQWIFFAGAATTPTVTGSVSTVTG